MIERTGIPVRHRQDCTCRVCAPRYVPDLKCRQCGSADGVLKPRRHEARCMHDCLTEQAIMHTRYGVRYPQRVPGRAFRTGVHVLQPHAIQQARGQLLALADLNTTPSAASHMQQEPRGKNERGKAGGEGHAKLEIQLIERSSIVRG